MTLPVPARVTAPVSAVDLNETVHLRAQFGRFTLHDHRGTLPEGPHDAPAALVLLREHVPGWTRSPAMKRTLEAWLADPRPSTADAAQAAILEDHRAHFPSITARIQACPPLRQELIAQIQMDDPASAQRRFKAALTGACLAWGFLPDSADLQQRGEEALRFRQRQKVKQTWDPGSPDPAVSAALKALHTDPAFLRAMQHIARLADDYDHALHALICGWLLASGYPRTIWVYAAATGLTFHARHPQPGDPSPTTPLTSGPDSGPLRGRSPTLPCSGPV